MDSFISCLCIYLVPPLRKLKHMQMPLCCYNFTWIFRLHFLASQGCSLLSSSPIREDTQSSTEERRAGLGFPTQAPESSHPWAVLKWDPNDNSAYLPWSHWSFSFRTLHSQGPLRKTSDLIFFYLLKTFFCMISLIFF